MSASEVIVIGSGFGGSVAAAKLVEAGVAVTLIERGPWRDTVPVRSMGITERAPLPQGSGALKRLVRTLRNRWLPGGAVTLNRGGLFDIHLGRGLHVVCSSGVGGGSHVYAGLNVKPPDPAWWDSVGASLNATDMDRHYDEVMARMGSRAPMRDDQLPNTLEERFADSPIIDAAGADYQLTMGFAFPETPGQPRKIVTEDGVERWEARPGEDGNLGSEGGGKTTLDFAYLARAMKQGLTVRDRCEVLLIRRTPTGYELRVRDDATGNEERLQAPRVILAAGTLNSLRLLLASEAAGALAPMRGLGQHFGGNGDFFGYWKLDDEERELHRSMPAHGALRVRADEPLGANREWPLLAEGALPSPAALPLGRWVSRMLSSGSFVAGMGADAQDGTVRYRHGKLLVDYDPDGSPLFARIRDAFRYVGERTGRRIYHFKTPITVHPTGGACIGDDPDHGVVDNNGEVFANPGLFVADASAFPKPVAGPPSMTIAAWASHVASALLPRLREGATESPPAR